MRNVTTPKPPMASPATRFMARICRSKRSRNRLTISTRVTHQSMDPQKMPPTSRNVSHHWRWPPMPSPASTARNERMVVGLVRVSSRVEEKSEPAAPSSPSRVAGRTGLRKYMAPMATSSRPPITRIQNSSRSRNWIRKVMLKPAMAPYSASAVAAPKPEIRPERRPLRSVREAHSTFTGPTGTAIAKPAMTPLDSSHRPMKSPSILISLPQVGQWTGRKNGLVGQTDPEGTPPANRSGSDQELAGESACPTFLKRLSQSDRPHRYVLYEASKDASERVRRTGAAYGGSRLRPDSGGPAGI